MWVDRRIDAESAKRQASHIGTVDEYLEALRSLKIGAHDAAMLRAHANATDRTLTATELAKAAGYCKYGCANLHYGGFGHEVADFLGLQPEKSEDGTPLWMSILAHAWKETGKSDKWRFTMHSEVAAALRILNMA